MKIKGIEGVSLLPSLGEIRKGAKKPSENKWGDDLKDHFRFTSTGNADKELEKIFREVYGDKPNHLKVYLPSDDIEEVFFGFAEEYTKGGVVHFCDTEYIWERDRISGKFYETEQMCPYHPGNPNHKDRPKDNSGKELGCQPNGRLSVILPDLTLAANRFGVVKVLTKSINDIRNIQGAITSFQQNFGSVKAVPFTLYREPRMVSAMIGGKKGRVEKWFVFLEPDASFTAKKLEAAHQYALGAGVAGALPDGQLAEARKMLAELEGHLKRFGISPELPADSPEALEDMRWLYGVMRVQLREYALSVAISLGHDEATIPMSVEGIVYYLESVAKEKA